MTGEKILELIEELKKEKTQKELSRQWRIWCKRKKDLKDRERIAIEAILTQRTNWKNVERAMKNLEGAGVYLKKIKEIGDKDIALLYPLLKPCGFYKKKAKYLYNLACFFAEFGFDIGKMMQEDALTLRKKLLKIEGIGKETADSILLYAFDKPVFVIDEYTRRLVRDFARKKGLSIQLSYEKLRKLFEELLKGDFRTYQDVHAAIVVYGKQNRKNKNKKAENGK
jgi:endonuclease-3 related protein